MQADPSLRDKQPNWQDRVQQQWQALFDRAAHLDLPQEVPSHLLCPLTMEVRHERGAGQGFGLGVLFQPLAGALCRLVGAVCWVALTCTSDDTYG